MRLDSGWVKNTRWNICYLILRRKMDTNVPSNYRKYMDYIDKIIVDVNFPWKTVTKCDKIIYNIFVKGSRADGTIMGRAFHQRNRPACI